MAAVNRYADPGVASNSPVRGLPPFIPLRPDEYPESETQLGTPVARNQQGTQNPFPFRAASEEERDRRRRFSRRTLGSPISARNLQPLRVNAAMKIAGRQMDRAEQDAARQRQLRQTRIKELKGRAKLKAMAQGSVIAQLEKIQKAAKQVRAILTVIGALASLTIIGILWTLLQWNVQMVWTIFGLPGKDFIGLPWPYVMVPVVIMLDILILLAIIAILVGAYLMGHPKEIVCIAPELAKSFQSAGIKGMFVKLFLKITSVFCN